MQNRLPTKPAVLVLVVKAARPLSLFIDFALVFINFFPAWSYIMGGLGVATQMASHSMR